MKMKRCIPLILAAVMTWACAMPLPAANPPIQALVITGGHDFDPPFFTVFEGHPDIAYAKAEQPQANAMFADGSAMKYDVVVLYDMWQAISEPEKAGFQKYLEAGKGLVSLHHSIANYQDWDFYRNLIQASYVLDEKGRDIEGRHYPQSTYKHDVWMNVQIADPDHPITRGMTGFKIYDEAYKGYYHAPGARLLLTCENPDQENSLAWIGREEPGRVVYIQLGHGKEAYATPEYRHLVAQAIRWAAHRPTAVPLFNGKDLTGWKAEGNAVWKVKDGILTGTQDEKMRPGDLLTETGYTDFELTVEFKAEWPCNSGVWFRYQSPEQAYQADILEWKNPVCWSGSLYCTGKMFLAMNENEKLVKRDDWNTFVIRCQGDHLTIDLNGVRTADVRDTTSDRGQIGFQVHPGDEFKNMAIHIRKMFLLPL